ncbi:MAG: hypothetical protein O2829_10555 [Bacteroidetes bacterium]|nr:hypothetical protein [Bacteroidota bacterium]MDA1269506.1 hypothetical protein [Bacteroidota bacterium]
MSRILPILVLVLLFSCQESESPKGCAVANPIEDLPWLREEIKNTIDLNLVDYFYLIQGTYKGATVFSFLNCCPFCRTVPQILDCEGKVINAFITDVTDQKVIWRPTSSVCN